MLDILIEAGYDGPFMYEVTPRNDPRGRAEYMKPVADSLYNCYKEYKRTLRRKMTH